MSALLAEAADYLDMPFGGPLIGNGDRPGELLDDAGALASADRFFLEEPNEPGRFSPRGA